MVHITLQETNCQISVDGVDFINYNVTKHILRNILTFFSNIIFI
jgi:hypothetical protein